MFTIIYLWAIESPKFELAISINTKIFKTLINLELASYALLQIPTIREPISAYPGAEGVLYNIGLLFNYEVEGYKVFIIKPL